MGSLNEFTDGDGLVDASHFPIRSHDIEIEWLEAQTLFFRRTAGAIGRTTGDVHNLWSEIKEHYAAPEAPQLYEAMDSVRSLGDDERETWFNAAGHIGNFAEDLRPLKQRLQRVEFEADALRNQVASGVWVRADDVARGLVILEPAELADWYDGAKTEGWVAWAEHRPSIERNDELIADAAQVTEQIRTATETMERRLREFGADHTDEGLVGVGSPGRFNSGLADASTNPTDISWFAPGRDWVKNASPDEIRDWWDRLDLWQQRALITGIPLVIGNLNGIPLNVRVQANEINIRNEIARLEHELAQLDNGVSSPAGGESLGGWLARADTMKRQREALREAIASYTKYLDLPDRRDQYGYNPEGDYGKVGTTAVAQVVMFDPANDAIATYNGSLDENGDIPGWVKNVAIHVPGTTTKVESYDGTDLRGYLMYDAASQVDGADPTAVITWAGGSLPQHVDAAWDGYSRDLGPKLAEFAAGVRRSEDSTLTVTGHSYGAAVVGHAEVAGLEADRILYVAGAGLGNDAETVANFPRTGDKPHYTMIARNDLVTGSSQNADLGHLGHGASAQDDPDALRLETGFQEAGDETSGTIEGMGPIGAHSGVYTVGSTAFNNLVGVITGTEVELYAPDRTQGNRYGGITWVDGIKHPDYEPSTVEITELEKWRTTP